MTFPAKPPVTSFANPTVFSGEFSAQGPIVNIGSETGIVGFHDGNGHTIAAAIAQVTAVPTFVGADSTSLTEIVAYFTEIRTKLNSVLTALGKSTGVGLTT